MTLRVAFMGTSDFAVPALEALAACDVVIPAVYTQPPRPASRGHKLKRSAVHEAGDALGLDVRTPESLRDAGTQAAFAALDLDLALVASYGLLLPRPVLDAPRLGCVNIHASLLPRWRGASPIQQAILAGDAQTGIDFFQMEVGLDTGPVLMEQAVEIGPRETAGHLHDRLATLAAAMVADLVEGLATGSLVARPQAEDGVTYAPKIDKAMGRIDWSEPADAIDRRIRAFEPAPGSWTTIGQERLRVRTAHPVTAHPLDAHGAPGTVIDMPLVVVCGRGALSLDIVQREGRRPLPAAELQRGFDLPVGSRLGCVPAELE